MKFNVEEFLYDVVKGIDYFDCVIKEILWLCLMLLMINCECFEVYDLNGMYIFVGIEILFVLYVMYCDFDVWLDLEKFDFERFCGFVKDICYVF